MARNPLNEAFLRTSFLSGANAAYVEDMQAEYERNPGSVSDEWRHFFESLNEERSGSRNGDRGPSWGVPPPELLENGELVAALTGEYEATEQHLRTSLQAKSHALGFEMTPAASPISRSLGGKNGSSTGNPGICGTLWMPFTG